MKNQNGVKTFAFKLADKKAKEAKPAPQWKAREGVSSAGCSGPYARGDRWPGHDNGIYC
ncbi:hypothetical protein LXA47_06710 [Massilia sp. P8910]|uniref:hypothetical protein n=1 Tax=Massilia antarctica TaxID=2765360 RepID=UPI0006BE01D8|nr:MULTISPECIES: hypothetical protein [Massilia]MCE3603299.1 hypothetical protein [Massilia antarctica]MCY0913437.1 hypothetical protein [Massilia sp. H27-R4]CUI09573.1 hypothetical protein BN2497_13923 [Janthinobacterium sp. CG23_2]CUU33359.1 hypothetical protein BN3177_13923 [Janthinobacterium sp. CG23_2]